MIGNCCVQAGEECAGYGLIAIGASAALLIHTFDLRRPYFLVVGPVSSAICFSAGSLALLMGGLLWTGGQMVKGVQSLLDSCVRFNHKKERPAIRTDFS